MDEIIFSSDDDSMSKNFVASIQKKFDMFITG